jgi:hypothetical protein
MVDLARIRRERLRRMEGDDLCPTRGGSEVAGERGDAAPLGRIRGDEGVSQDAGVSSRRVAVGRLPRTGRGQRGLRRRIGNANGSAIA